MPELPEVESIRRYIQRIEGNTVTDVEARDTMVFDDSIDLAQIDGFIEGHTIESVDRNGKYLVIRFDHGYLIYSLRMTGKVMLSEQCPADEEYVKLRLSFQTLDDELYFTSVRRLSRFYWFDGADVQEQENIARLGPDPLSDEFDWERFKACFEGRTGPIKTILMDQGFLAGVGNIYANEVCYLTGIDPRRPTNELGTDEKHRLYDTLPDLLKEAAEKGGSSFTNFVGGDGSEGSFHKEHKVYNRKGEPCETCGDPIKKIELSNRSTYFCEKCQR